MKYIFFDTETTGLERLYKDFKAPHSVYSGGDEVVQIGGLVLDESLFVSRMFCYYCDTLLSQSCAQALSVHGIDSVTIRKAIPNEFLDTVLYNNLKEFFEKDVIFIGYNVLFDLRLVSQTVRNSYDIFNNLQKTSTTLPTKGRWFLDVMSYLPRRMKLSQYYNHLTDERETFYENNLHRLPLDTNIPELLSEELLAAHNSLFDSIETYLLFKKEVLGKRIYFRGGH